MKVIDGIKLGFGLVLAYVLIKIVLFIVGLVFVIFMLWTGHILGTVDTIFTPKYTY